MDDQNVDASNVRLEEVTGGKKMCSVAPKKARRW